MKHRVGFNRLGRKPAHRKALHRNMVTSLFKHERIRTTKAKAREIRRTAEKMITRAKVDSVHNRRMVARDIKDKAILAKLFVDIGPRFKARPGGYTRMLKIGHRAGDASEMVLLELVTEEVEETSKSSRRRKGGEKKSAPKAEKAPAGDKASAAEKKVSGAKESDEGPADPGERSAASEPTPEPASGDDAPAAEAAASDDESASGADETAEKKDGE